MIDNRDISIYLMDGEYEGCLRCNFDGYNLVAYKIPRSEFSRLKNDSGDEVMKNSAIYFLLGGKNSKETVYIGQATARKNGNAALQRITEKHGNFEWSTAIIVTTEDNMLDRSALCYLENLFYRIAKDAGSYAVTNGAEPSSDNSIKQKDKRILAKFVDHVVLLTKLLGYYIFTPDSSVANKNGRIIPKTIDTSTIFYCKGRGANAIGHRTEKDGFIVLKGSVISSFDPSPATTKTTRTVRDENAEYVQDYTLLGDLVFASPSAASNYVMFSNTNGNAEWVTEEGTRLGSIRNTKETITDRKPYPSANTEVTQRLYCTDRGSQAKGYINADGQFVVEKGSQLTTMEATNSCPESAKKAYNGVKTKNNKLVEDIIFPSASAASNFVLLASTNGNDRWHTEDGTILGKIREKKK